MDTNELKELNNSNFSDSPVASQQATESAKVNNNPPILRSPNPIQPQTKVVGKGKNKRIVPITTPTAYDFANNARLQAEAGYQDSTQGGNNIFRTQYGDEYFDAKWMGINFGSVNNSTSDPYMGRNPLNPNIDFEHLRRNSQSTVGATVNTATQFAGKTLVNAVGGVVGGFYSIGSALANWDSTKLYDNNVNRALDEATDWVDQNNSVFTSQRANEENSLIGFNVETMKNLSDGFSFIAGAVLSEITTAGLASGSVALSSGSKLARLNKLPLAMAVGVSETKITGLLPTLKSYGQAVKRSQDALELIDETNRFTRGLSQAEKAERLASILGDTSSTIEDIKRFSEGIKTYGRLGRELRTTVTGTFWEAGLEGRQARDEFYETNLANAYYEIDSMNVSEEEKVRLKQAKEREVSALAENAGMLTFGLNVAVLKTSNNIQFPSVFGSPSKLNPNKFKNTFKKVGDKFELPKSVKATDIGRYFGAVIKNAATEGAEELSQGLISGASQDYYKDILQSRTSDKVLQGPISGFLNSLEQTFNENVDDKEFWREGAIGAVMGAFGLPMLKRNSAGKLRKFTWSGGAYDDIQKVNQFKSDRNLALTKLNSLPNDLDDINGYNVDRAKRLELLNRRDDLAMMTNNEQEYNDNRQHKIYNLVTDAKNKGISDYLDQSLDEINNMSLKEYESRFGFPKDSLTQEMMDADKKDTLDSFKRFSDAYEMVYNKLDMDDIKNSRIGTKMFDLLVHSVGYEQYLNKQLASIKNNIINSDFWKNADYTEQELDEVVKDTIEYKSAMENFNYRLDKAINKEYNRVQDDIRQNEFEYNDMINVLPDNIQTIFNEGFNSYNALIKAGKDQEAQNLLDSINTSLSEASINSGIEISGVPLEQKITDTFNKKSELYKKVNDLDKNKIKQNIIDKDSEEYKTWKADLQTEIDSINKQLKEKHDRDTKLMLNKDKAQQLTLDKVLNVIEANNRFNTAKRQARENILAQDNTLLTQVQKDSININNELEKFEIIYAKKLSTIRMASQLLNARPDVAYRQTAYMEFDANMEQLQFQVYELRQSLENVNEDGIENLIIDLAYVETSYDKIMLDLEALKNDFNVSDSMLSEQENYLTGVVKSLIDRVNTFVLSEDSKDDATKEVLERGNEKISNETNDAIKDIADNEQRFDDKEQATLEQLANNMNSMITSDPTKDTPNSSPEAISEKEQKALDNIETEPDTTITPFQVKEMYTVYHMDNPDTGNQSIDQRPLADKVKDGTIKYNQTATLEIPTENELEDKGFLDYLKSRNIDPQVYINGKNKFNKAVETGKLDILNQDYNDMDPDIKLYILNTRLYFNIYDSQIEKVEGVQVANTEGANELHRMFFMAPVKNNDPKVKIKINKFEQEIVNLNRELQSSRLEIINSTTIDDRTKADKLSRLNSHYDTLIANKKNQLDSIVTDKNYFTNFALRRNALIYNKQNNEALPLRIGNFLNGEIQPSTTVETDYLDNNNLANEMTAEFYDLTDEFNGLIDDLDNFNLDNLVYVTSDFKSRKLRTFSDNRDAELNMGSLVNKVYGNTGEVYFIHTTRNGQQIPVKLNRNRLGYNPDLVDGINTLLKDYINNKNLKSLANKKIKGQTGIMSIFNGYTYQQFFEIMFKRFKSDTNFVDSNSLGVINIDNNGLLHFGDTKITSLEEYNANEAMITSIISNSRPVINQEYIRNGNSNKFNDLGKWFVNNQLLSHNFNVSQNVDKIFKRDDSKAVPFQIHMLNTSIKHMNNRVSKVKNQLKDINLLFTGDPNISENQTSFSVRNLNKYIILQLIEDVKNAGVNVNDSVVNHIIDQTILNKQIEMSDFLAENMELSTNLTWNFSKNKYNINKLIEDLRKSTNPLDLYLYHYLNFLTKFKTKKDRTNKLRNYYKVLTAEASNSTNEELENIETGKDINIGNIISDNSNGRLNNTIATPEVTGKTVTPLSNFSTSEPMDAMQMLKNNMDTPLNSAPTVDRTDLDNLAQDLQSSMAELAKKEGIDWNYQPDSNPDNFNENSEIDYENNYDEYSEKETETDYSDYVDVDYENTDNVEGKDILPNAEFLSMLGMESNDTEVAENVKDDVEDNNTNEQIELDSKLITDLDNIISEKIGNIITTNDDISPRVLKSILRMINNTIIDKNLDFDITNKSNYITFAKNVISKIDPSQQKVTVDTLIEFAKTGKVGGVVINLDITENDITSNLENC